jgi:hypothetical protein
VSSARLAVATALALLGTPAPALAGSGDLGTIDGVTYMRGIQAVSTGQVAPINVQCPGDTKVAGLGAQVNRSGLKGRINVLRPTDGSDGDGKPDDLAASFLYNTGSADTAETYAMCVSGRVKYRNVTKRLPAGEDVAAKVTCPDGTSVTGGGAFITDDASQAWIFSSHPFDGGDRKSKPDDGWRIAATNVLGTGRKDLTAYVICRPGRFVYCQADTGINGLSAIGVGDACSLGNSFGPVLSSGARMPAPGQDSRIGGIYPVDNPITDVDTAPDDYASAEVENNRKTSVEFDYYAIHQRP